MYQNHYITIERASRKTVDLHIPEGHNTLAVVNVSFSKSYYNVRPGENEFKLDSTTHSLTPGAYDIDEFLTAINTAISPSSVSLSSITGKMTLTSSANELSFPSTSSIWKMMGFAQESTNTISSTLESTYICDLQAITQVYICTDAIRDDSSHQFGDMLATFYVNDSPDYSNIIWYNPKTEMTGKPLRFKLRQNYALPCTFSVLDQSGNLLELNGGNISMTLVSWKDEDINSILKDYIGIRLNQIRIEEVEKENKK